MFFLFLLTASASIFFFLLKMTVFTEIFLLLLSRVKSLSPTPPLLLMGHCLQLVGQASIQVVLNLRP